MSQARRLLWIVPFLASMMLWMSAVPAAAHAIVVRTSLKERPVKPHTATTVVLRFNVAVELSFTRMSLVNPQEEQRSLPFSGGSQAGEVIVHLPPLEPGAYTLRYKVLASDGHLTEDGVRFRVSQPQ